uniref:Uncharacterized protein n=1 Tax=Rhizophora mucronata TaxID=61149 RepID=A0A2P2LU19_RHIMU
MDSSEGTSAFFFLIYVYRGMLYSKFKTLPLVAGEKAREMKGNENRIRFAL